MGIYLFIIASFDAYFRDEYNKHARQWMRGIICTAGGAMAVASSETSVLILAYMSIERFLCIVRPFGGHQMNATTAYFSLGLIWGAGKFPYEFSKTFRLFCNFFRYFVGCYALVNLVRRRNLLWHEWHVFSSSY